MPIHLNCPNCQAQINVPSEYAGQLGPCPKCGHEMSVPVSREDRPSTKPRGVLALRLRLRSLVRVGFWGGVLLLVAWLVYRAMPGPEGLREISNTAQCHKNLRRIGQAMFAYEEAYGTFPPAYVADENGRPMHSWRVLILPYLDREDLYDKYDFNEAWNGPNNSLLAEEIGDIYRCPSDAESGSQWMADEDTVFVDTSYMVVVGRNTVSNGPSAKSLSDVTDPPGDTLLVVETAGSCIHWMDPRDLALEDIVNENYNQSVPTIYGEHPTGAHAVMFDGSVRTIPDLTEPVRLKAMSTINGGE